MREERGPASSVAVERREAPHPYVIGVRAPSQGARRTLARFARVRIATHPAPPGAPFPLRAREKEKGERATPGARKSKSPGGEALASACSGKACPGLDPGWEPVFRKEH